MKSSSTLIKRSANRLYAITVSVAAVLTVSCRHTPEGVLDKEEMAQLMADIHMGEAMIDFNYSTYPNDSTRKMLKQSIYDTHHVTPQEVDTSYVWYGNHIEDYIKVYDRTIEIIQQRQRDVASSVNGQISVAGDSVQVWSGPERLMVRAGMPSRIIGFNISPDSTWQKGDIYTLSYKLINSQAKADARLLVDYSDGTTSYAEEPEIKQTKNLLKIQVDSTLTPVRIYGYVCFTPEKNISFEVDSMSLTRVRRELMPSFYARRKTFEYGLENSKGPIDENQLETSDEEREILSKSNRGNNPTKARHASETSIRRNASDNLPQPSSQTGNQSGHREDASLHKPTPAQRREAARQRSATTRQKSKATQTIKPMSPSQKNQSASKSNTPDSK